MGIDFTGLRALFFLKRTESADFSKVVTLGRHEIFFHKGQFEFLRAKSGLALCYSDKFSSSSFQEPLLEAFGAKEIESIDASDYEDASIIFDFNHSVPERYRNRFSMYIDFGSMEHIFNVPQVVTNINNLLQENGTALILTNANGDAGHGFFQFSPEFFFSAFSAENGFRDTVVFLIDRVYPRNWLAVKSPAILRGRNEITYNRKWYVLCITCKLRTVEAVSAQQSDYKDIAWNIKAHRRQLASRKKIYHRLTRISPYLYTYVHSMFYYNFLIRPKFRQHTIHFDPEAKTMPIFERS